MNTEERLRSIEYQLIKALHPTDLSVQDDSAQHAGHPGAQGAGHFTVTVTASSFTGKSLPERHRMVYDALSSLMDSEIHALSIKAIAPEE